MNTNKLKSYAPKARIAFMQAVTKRAAVLGLYEDCIADVNIQGDNAIIEGRVFTRKQGQQRNQLVNRIESLGTHDGKLNLKAGFKQFINETAFTWFNRFTAIRYMEINGYLEHGFRVLSKPPHSDGSFAKFDEGFEILSHAADVADDLGLDKAQMVQMMLDGDKEEDLYREILLGQCHQLSNIMAFMFEKLDDATELLIPDNLTKTDSILKALIDDLPEDNWRDIEGEKGQIEVIGWLYQFYISEHKDAVIGKVVKREDIPAATQLFTPNWIVKYLVQNSLGRQWLATYPDSALKDKMEYYITPAQQSDDVIAQLKAITPASIDPETIKVLDPACGSGHILVEVYGVLREIYLENGYRLREIPELILTKNIYGLDIDDRAAQMAAFAVLMKAREDDKRIFNRITDSVGTENEIKLNIYSLQSTENLDINKLWSDLDLEGKQQSDTINDMFAESEVDHISGEYQAYLDLLNYLKAQFVDAKNLGSLIEIDSQNRDVLTKLKEMLLGKAQSSHQPTRQAVELLLPILEQAIVLANKYDVVVANPPYMGSGNFNPQFKKSLKGRYKLTRTDLYAIFIERMQEICTTNGYLSIITMQNWMFTASYLELRENILSDLSIDSLVQLGSRGFESISGEIVSTAMFVLRNKYVLDYVSNFIRLTEYNAKEKELEFSNQSNKFNFKQDEFRKVTGSPIVYWKDDLLVRLFSDNAAISEKCDFREGIHTANNEKYVRSWWEIDLNLFSLNVRDYDDFDKLNVKWVPYNKGGGCYRWYGNYEYVVAFDNSSRLEMSRLKGHVRPSQSLYFKSGGTWSDIGTKGFSVKYYPKGFLFDGKGPVCVGDDIELIISALNSKVFTYIAELLMPTVSYKCGTVKSVPYPISSDLDKVGALSKELINITKTDYDSHELSWDHVRNSLLENKSRNISDSISLKVNSDLKTVEKVKELEQKNNLYWISAYGLTSELTCTQPLESINLNANHSWKYQNKNKTFNEDQLSKLFVSNSNKELLSYTIGCMMGRYSLDREGLIYAHSGNKGFKELVTEGAYNTFPADDDGIIPLAAEEWLFEDDATTRFREFVKTVWGKEHLTENLDFVAESLCLDAIKAKKGEGAMDTIRRYFSTQFYKDHLKTYKKRPIYWLFSSGKEKAFECLVYLHRYNESTLARMRTEYVTPLMGKIETQLAMRAESINNAPSTAEKNRLTKELKSLEKKQAELRAFDEELKHFSEMKISIDLDDGVKMNYGKFGNLLSDVKDIHGEKPESVK